MGVAFDDADTVELQLASLTPSTSAPDGETPRSSPTSYSSFSPAAPGSSCSAVAFPATASGGGGIPEVLPGGEKNACRLAHGVGTEAPNGSACSANSAEAGGGGGGGGGGGCMDGSKHEGCQDEVTAERKEFGAGGGSGGGGGGGGGGGSSGGGGDGDAGGDCTSGEGEVSGAETGASKVEGSMLGAEAGAARAKGSTKARKSKAKANGGGHGNRAREIGLAREEAAGGESVVTAPTQTVEVSRVEWDICDDLQLRGETGKGELRGVRTCVVCLWLSKAGTVRTEQRMLTSSADRSRQKSGVRSYIARRGRATETPVLPRAHA